MKESGGEYHPYKSVILFSYLFFQAEALFSFLDVLYYVFILFFIPTLRFKGYFIDYAITVVPIFPLCSLTPGMRLPSRDPLLVHVCGLCM